MIGRQYLNQAFDPQNEYSVPYTWGTVGVVYNTKHVDPEDVGSWDLLWNEKYKLDDRPIGVDCNCPACRNYSRSYIRHLIKAKESLGMRLAVAHNLYFYNTLMERIRENLDNGTYGEFYRHNREILDKRI